MFALAMALGTRALLRRNRRAVPTYMSAVLLVGAAAAWFVGPMSLAVVAVVIAPAIVVGVTSNQPRAPRGA